MPLNEQTISFFLFFTMQFYQHRLVGFPTKPKKILGPKITFGTSPLPLFVLVSISLEIS